MHDAFAALDSAPHFCPALVSHPFHGCGCGAQPLPSIIPRDTVRSPRCVRRLTMDEGDKQRILLVAMLYLLHIKEGKERRKLGSVKHSSFSFSRNLWNMRIFPTAQVEGPSLQRIKFSARVLSTLLHFPFAGLLAPTLRN